MNVLHIITGLNNGGAEAVLFRLVTSDKNHTHQVISLTDSGVYGQRLSTAGISVYSLNMPRGSVTINGLFLLYGLIRKINPDVLQTWMYHADLIGGIVARFAGVRRVIWGIRNSNIDAKRTALSTRLTVHLCALISGIVPHKIICCSEQAAPLHISLGYAKRKMVVIPNGYDLVQFSPSEEKRRGLRSDFGILDSEVVVGMVARWDPQKDHQNCIAALALLDRECCTPWRCLLVGSDMQESNSELTMLLKKYSVVDRVMLLGPRSDIPAMMNVLDIHVLSSYGEAFPNVVAEAMACGVPCVVTDVGDAKLIVDDTGWCVPRTNPAALAGALSDAIRQRSEGDWSERSVRCRQRIVKNFTMEKMVCKYSEVWGSALREA